MKRTHSIIPVVIFFLVGFLHCPDTLAQGEMYTLKSDFNHKTYHLYVSLPRTYVNADTVRYPVLYVLDGRFSFASFYSIRQGLDLGREIRDIIIVAIADNSETDSDWIAGRYNDFTPSSVPQSDSQWTSILHMQEGKLKSGGADLFLSTLQCNMIPFIDKQYKTSADRGLSGHSLGGLLVGYCLLKKPGLFNRYGINSPSFWWNNNEILSLENEWAKQGRFISANIFFSAGALEGPMMIAPVTAFADSLKNQDYKGLTVTTRIFEDETHLSVVPACSSKTLKVLYGYNVK